MKIAKLPDGKVLKFPPHTPDEAIDTAVKAHLKDHIEKKQNEMQDRENLDTRHKEMINGIGIIVNLLNSHHELLNKLLESHKGNNVDLIENMNKGHESINKSIGDLIKTHNKKKRLVRDKDGRPLGVENV